jgi:acyl transferase domain-containing protein
MGMQCVVSGSCEAIENFQAELAGQEIETRRLHTSHAFHSPMMEPVMTEFAAEVATLGRHIPQITYISNLTSDWIKPGEATDPQYWANHLRQPVQFAAGLAVLNQNPTRILLEVGPGQTLAQLASRQPHRPPGQTVLTSSGGPQATQDELETILQTLGKLWLAGVAPDWANLYAGELPGRLHLPTYPFERQRYWVEPQTGFMSGGKPAIAIESSPVKNPQLSEWFYYPTWKRTRLGGEVTSGEPRRWLFLADRYQVAEKLAAT